jgi:hypothetical protein
VVATPALDAREARLQGGQRREQAMARAVCYLSDFLDGLDDRSAVERAYRRAGARCADQEPAIDG